MAEHLASIFGTEKDRVNCKASSESLDYYFAVYHYCRLRFVAITSFFACRPFLLQNWVNTYLATATSFCLYFTQSLLLINSNYASVLFAGPVGMEIDARGSTTGPPLAQRCLCRTCIKIQHWTPQLAQTGCPPPLTPERVKSTLRASMVSIASPSDWLLTPIFLSLTPRGFENCRTCRSCPELFVSVIPFSCPEEFYSSIQYYASEYQTILVRWMRLNDRGSSLQLLFNRNPYFQQSPND